MNKTKRVLSVVLAVLMLSSLIAALAIADGQHTVVINYVFENGKQAAPSWTATLAEGSSLEQTVTSPTVVGYEPDQATVDVSVNNITENKTYTVTYYPANVGFTVNHYLQNVADNNYTLDKTEEVDGYTESEVGDGLAKAYPGFAALLYNTKAKVAADGSTVVEIYYDRNYYMMSFNLDGGYGVEPIYARYGASVKVENPTKPGYTFNGWEPTVPTTVPAENTTYKAKWQAEKTAKVTVVVWGENADDENYSYIKSVETTAPVGSTLTAIPSGTNLNMGTKLWELKRVEQTTVAADGSSVLNVYYDRKEFTLTFKYDYRSVVGDGHVGATYQKTGTITAKWDADIGAKFLAMNTAAKGSQWSRNENGKDPWTAFLQIMPAENRTYYCQNTSNTAQSAYYYTEGLDGKYVLKHTVNAYYKNSLYISSEDFYPMEGFTYDHGFDGDDDELPSPDDIDDDTNVAYPWSGAKFYYKRNSYDLVFISNNTEVETSKVKFEAALGTSNGESFAPSYPSNFEPNAFEFAGWYQDPEGVKPVDWNAKMPAASVTVYAKWAPKNHTVTTFLTKEKIEEGEFLETYHVPHGTAVTNTPEDPPNGSYVFVGWFYEENGVEKAFDFSMPIVKDLNLYAKWSSNTLVAYTIKYVLEKDGTTVIADETTGSALAGTTLTFEAKTGDELNKDYQSGYFPETGSHSLTMDINGNNKFTFVYEAKAKVGYTVRYLEKGTEKVLHEEKTAETSNAIITEKFVQISGYAPDAYQKRLVLSANEAENVITFWYTEDELHAPVQIVHWTQNIAGEGYTEYQSSTNLNGVIGQTYTGTPLTIPGFTYNEEKSNASGKLTANGLELNLYYDRVKYSYTVRYVDATDNNKDIDPAANVTGEGLFGAQVIGSQKKFNGYMPADNEPAQKSIIIGTGTNEIIFYYYPCYYIGHVQGTNVRIEPKRLYPGAKASLTDAVTTGYLYGGTFDNVDCTTVHDFGEENAINFTPVKGKKYYIWEVSQNYLKPRAYVVSRHDPDNNGGYNVVGLYLTSSVDRNMYSEVGFTVDGTNFASDGGKVYDKVQAVYTDNKEVKEEMYVDSTGVWKVQKEADSSHGGYVSICTVSMNYFYDKNAASPLSYQPYWVTLDGIKVTGAYEARTCYYQGVGYNDVWISDCVSSNSRVSIYRAATTNTIGVESVAVLSAAPETVQPEVPVTPEIPEVPEAPEMTLNSDAMYLRAQYTYEMMTNTVRFISAIDVNECTEYGFVINGEVVKCEEAAETVDGYDANYLFGGSVNGAMLMSCNMLLDGLVDGMTLNVTPYYVALDGTTVVYGETRTLVYRQWVGLEG